MNSYDFAGAHPSVGKIGKQSQSLTKTMDIEIAAKEAFNNVTFGTSNTVFPFRINSGKIMQRTNVQSNGRRHRS